MRNKKPRVFSSFEVSIIKTVVLFEIIHIAYIK